MNIVKGISDVRKGFDNTILSKKIEIDYVLIKKKDDKNKITCNITLCFTD